MRRKSKKVEYQLPTHHRGSAAQPGTGRGPGHGAGHCSAAGGPLGAWYSWGKTSKQQQQQRPRCIDLSEKTQRSTVKTGFTTVPQKGH